jgi:hypothetical protein
MRRRSLREGDARVLNAYVYWFALPALFVANISEMNLDRGNARFVLACVLPVLGAAAVLAAITRPPGPTMRAMPREKWPMPHPTSSTVIPGRTQGASNFSGGCSRRRSGLSKL